MTTYEINQNDQVVPHTSGRQCADTRAWRDATELELAQREEINELEARIHELADMLDATNDMNIKHVNEANRYNKALGCIRELLVKGEYDHARILEIIDETVSSTPI